MRRTQRRWRAKQWTLPLWCSCFAVCDNSGCDCSLKGLPQRLLCRILRQAFHNKCLCGTCMAEKSIQIKLTNKMSHDNFRQAKSSLYFYHQWPHQVQEIHVPEKLTWAPFAKVLFLSALLTEFYSNVPSFDICVVQRVHCFLCLINTLKLYKGKSEERSRMTVTDSGSLQKAVLSWSNWG